MLSFYSGTSNIELIEKNKSEFPADFRSGSRLTYYASLFNSLEVNSTFYRLPLPATLCKWAGEVPESFRFTLKVWREITHARDLAFNTEAVARFMGIANQLEYHKGALLIQLPAGTRDVHIARLDTLLGAIQKLNPASRSWDIAVEFRHSGWNREEIFSVVAAHDAVVVWHDRPVMGEAERFAGGRFVYLRFHGPAGDYKGSYGDDFLADKARFIRECIARGKRVYAYFNNTMLGDAPRNLMTLNGMVASKSPWKYLG